MRISRELVGPLPPTGVRTHTELKGWHDCEELCATQSTHEHYLRRNDILIREAFLLLLGVDPQKCSIDMAEHYTSANPGSTDPFIVGYNMLKDISDHDDIWKGDAAKAIPVGCVSPAVLAEWIERKNLRDLTDFEFNPKFLIALDKLFPESAKTNSEILELLTDLALPSSLAIKDFKNFVQGVPIQGQRLLAAKLMELRTKSGTTDKSSGWLRQIAMLEAQKEEPGITESRKTVARQNGVKAETIRKRARNMNQETSFDDVVKELKKIRAQRRYS